MLRASGRIRFATGQRSAAEDFVDLSLETQLQSKNVADTGWCEVRDPLSVVPPSTPCLSAGKCIACWSYMAQVGGASAYVSTEVPYTYFKVDFSLLADDRPQGVTYQNFGVVRFAVTDAASEYCVHATLRPRGQVDAKTSVKQCRNSDTFLPPMVPVGFTGLPVDGCVEDARLAHYRDRNAAGGEVWLERRGSARSRAQTDILPSSFR